MPRALTPRTQVELGDGATVGAGAVIVGVGDGRGDGGGAGADVTGEGDVDVGPGADGRDPRGSVCCDGVDGALVAAGGVFMASASTGPAGWDDWDGWDGCREEVPTGATGARDGSPGDCPAIGWPAGGAAACRPSTSVVAITAATAIAAANADEAVPYCQRRISWRLLRDGRSKA